MGIKNLYLYSRGLLTEKAITMIRNIFLTLITSLLLANYSLAQSVKITGKVKNGGGYTVLLLSKDGSSKSVTLTSNGKFSFSGVRKSSLKNASLQLVSSEGRHFGPVVLSKKGSKVSTTFSGKLDSGVKVIALGNISLKNSYATITSKATTNAGVAIAKAKVKSSSGKPIGAGEQGLVQTSSSARIKTLKASEENSNGIDSDLDGLPDAFDADDDGDLVLDASDSDSSGADVPYSSMNLDFRKTINSHVRTGLSDSIIDAVISGENTFNLTTFISLPQNIASSVTAGHVVCNESLPYCKPNNPTSLFGGVSESGTEFKGKFWSELLNSDGFPRLESINLGGFPVMLASIQPRVGRDQFRVGDVIRTVLTGASGEVSSRTFTVAPYFVSVPAMLSYNGGSGVVNVDYSSVSPTTGSIPGTSSGDPIVLTSDGLLTVTFWRPQRPAIRSDETGYYDWGRMNYGLSVGELQATCAGLYSNVSSDLVADSTPFGNGDSVFYNQGANGTPYRDSQDDRAASITNTLTFTVNLKECINRTGRSSSGTFFVDLTAAGESVTGGKSTASQVFYVQIP